jgi:hypothetical protein
MSRRSRRGYALAVFGTFGFFGFGGRFGVLSPMDAPPGPGVCRAASTSASRPRRVVLLGVLVA